MSGILALLARPRWAVGAVLVVALSTGFAMAGLWQLDRLEERRDRNARVAAALEKAPVELASGLGEYTRVTTTGEWLGDAEFSLPLQTRDGRAGLHLLTVIETPAGRFLVDRGWVPLDGALAYERAGGEAAITAVVRRPSSGEVTGATEGGRPTVSGRDPAAIGAASGLTIEQEVLYLTSQRPEPAPAPLPPLAPDLSEGNHLLYAIQWFSFIAIAVVGYAALLWRNQPERARPDTIREPGS